MRHGMRLLSLLRLGPFYQPPLLWGEEYYGAAGAAGSIRHPA